MKETNLQTQPVRERRSAFGSNTGPNTGSEPGHNVWPRISLDAGPESAPASVSDLCLDGGLARDPGSRAGSRTGFAHDPWAAEKAKPGLGPGSLDAFTPAQRQLYAEALKACHLEKRRGFREFVRGADPKWDAAPALRPMPDDQPRSHGRSSRYHSCGRRPPEACAARLLDYLQGDPWQPGIPRSLEPEREAQERPSTLEGEAKPKVQTGAPVPSEPHRNIQDQPATPLNFESPLKEEALHVTRALGRELQTPALLNFESLIEARARENTPEAEAEAKAQAPGLSESSRGIMPQPSALARDCEPRGNGNDGSDAPKARLAPKPGETTRGEDRHPRGLALFFAHFCALSKRLVRKFL